MDATSVGSMLLIHRRNSESEDSSSSDEDWEEALRKKGKLKLRPRITCYADVVGSYMDYEFKSHFRLVII